MDKSAVLAGSFSLFIGLMILFGEYLCVELVWVCSSYQPVIISIGLTLLVVGFIFLWSAKDARNDL